MRKRILSILTALAVLAGLGFVGLQAASATTHASLINPNPVAAGPYHSGNIQCATDGTRINGTWDHYCPPGWHYAQVAAEDVYGSVAAPVGVVKPPVTTGSEVVPTLSQNNSPGVGTVSLKWSAAVAPVDNSVVGYEVRYRRVVDAAWVTPTASLSNVLVYTQGGLWASTAYFFQVRARYSTATDFGPWSNTLSVATDTP